MKRSATDGNVYDVVMPHIRYISVTGNYTNMNKVRVPITFVSHISGIHRDTFINQFTYCLPVFTKQNKVELFSI